MLIKQCTLHIVIYLLSILKFGDFVGIVFKTCFFHVTCRTFFIFADDFTASFLVDKSD